MSVPPIDVAHIAALAHLSFGPEEERRMERDLGEIVAYVEKLNELDTSEVEPLTQVTAVENVLRPDVPSPSLPPGEALANAPARLEQFFAVPKVIGG
jgi:aspartyl-tRNA(Asn)/glutamyl-tRNA(Gln) amidotransferase subunit C